MLKVTIAIPTFNRANTVCNAIESVLSQTYSNIEIIVSDNASIDDTFKIISSYTDNNITILRQSVNIGMVGNWNACLEKASGDYFILLSDDDLLNPCFVDKCIAVIDENAEELPAIIYTRTNVNNNNDSYITRSGLEKEAGYEFVTNWFNGNREIYLCGTIYNTRYLKLIGGFPDKPVIMTDSAAIAAVAFLGSVVHVNESLATYEWHSGSISSRTSLTDWVDDDYNLAQYVVEHSSKEWQFKVSHIMMRRAYNGALGRISHEALHIDNKISAAWTVLNHCLSKYGLLYMLRVLLSSSALKVMLPSKTISLLKKIRLKIKYMSLYDLVNLCRREYLKLKTKHFYGLFIAELGSGTYIDNPVLFAGLEYMKIGSNVIIFKNCRIELLNMYGNDIFTPELIIGNYTQIHQNAHITCAKNINIGKNVVITSNVTITDINHLYDDIETPINLQKIDVRPVTIGDQTYIYNNSVILPGISIGKHCIVAANSVVGQNIPDYCLVAGSPAKLIRRYNHDSKKWEKVIQ